MQSPCQPGLPTPPQRKKLQVAAILEGDEGIVTLAVTMDSAELDGEAQGAIVGDRRVQVIHDEDQVVQLKRCGHDSSLFPKSATTWWGMWAIASSSHSYRSASAG